WRRSPTSSWHQGRRPGKVADLSWRQGRRPEELPTCFGAKVGPGGGPGPVSAPRLGPEEVRDLDLGPRLGPEEVRDLELGPRLGPEKVRDLDLGRRPRPRGVAPCARTRTGGPTKRALVAQSGTHEAARERADPFRAAVGRCAMLR